jgi:purine-cytosine permease-like protein
MPGFAEKYAAHMVDRAKASGASQQKLDETERQAKVMQGAQVFLKNAVVGVVGVVGTGLSLQQGSEYYVRNTCVGRLFGVCEASRGWKQQ